MESSFESSDTNMSELLLQTHSFNDEFLNCPSTPSSSINFPVDDTQFYNQETHSCKYLSVLFIVFKILKSFIMIVKFCFCTQHNFTLKVLI